MIINLCLELAPYHINVNAILPRGILADMFRASSSVIGHLDNIIYPKIVSNIHLDGELAVIMKREARRVSADKAMDYVLGYTFANNVMAQIREEKVLRG